MSTELVERDIISRAQKGDKDSFRQLVECYERRVKTLAISFVGNAEEAEDVAQEVFIRIYKSIRNFQGDSAFFTWIYKITKNIVIDRQRKRLRRPEDYTDDADWLDVRLANLSSSQPLCIPLTSGIPDQELERKQLRRLISQSMTLLSVEHRTVIILREFEGLSYKEMSEVVGISEGTVMSRLYHARKNLQAILSVALENTDSGASFVGDSKAKMGR